MTTDEKLDLILDKVNALDEKVNALNEKVNALDEKVNALDEKVNALDKKVNALENRVDSLEETVKHNTLVTEGLVSKCVKVIGESITMNAERFDRVDFDSIKRNYEVAVLYAQTVKEQVDSLTKKMDNIA